LDVGAGYGGGGQATMKIYFLLMIVSVFVAFSYMPIRSEAKQSSVTARLRTRVLPSR
jgi:hypothetical protein